MRTVHALLAGSFAACAFASGSICAEGEGWREVWRDDFDGTALNESAWTVLTGYNDSRVRDACGTTEAVQVSGGKLIITSDRGTVAGCPYNLKTGAVQTKDKVYWKGHTRVCVNAVLPGVIGKAQGVWPAHWLMPNTDTCWPKNGEIDVLEMIDGDGYSWQTYHAGTECGGKSSSIGGKVPVAAWNTTVHEYAVEYSADEIIFYTDARVVKRMSASEAALFDVPYYLILQTALGGPWPGPVTRDTVFPITHTVDSVVVVQKS